MGESGMTTATAWVESPLQFLSVLEAHHTGHFADHCRVVPRSGAIALDATVAEIERWGPPHRLTVAAQQDQPAGPGTASGPWFVGDAFSGQVQQALLRGSKQRIVIVDDGLATLHLLRLLVRRTPTPLVRARAAASPARRALGLATALRLRSAARAGRLTVFTVLPLPDELALRAWNRGIDVVRHRFSWLSAQPDNHAPRERRVVLGAALARDGLVHTEPYLEWVAAQAKEEPVAYFPHRREDERTLRPLARTPGVRVVHDGLPVEVGLRSLGVDHRVVSLPSTAVTSLRTLLGPRGVTIDATHVPDTWWTAQASPELRAHLGAVVSSGLPGAGPGTEASASDPR
ncbi:hypothetical protein J4H86_20720 [Spiractinospora alimapuensis]|nr:hypothetical protein J4H86_20720 [Spiractinospora alimapuensis]